MFVILLEQSTDDIYQQPDENFIVHHNFVKYGCIISSICQTGWLVSYLVVCVRNKGYVLGFLGLGLGLGLALGLGESWVLYITTQICSNWSFALAWKLEKNKRFESV